LFNLDEDSKTAMTTVKAKVGELEVDIPGVEADACHGL
jgi:hypothetical protein